VSCYIKFSSHQAEYLIGTGNAGDAAREGWHADQAEVSPDHVLWFLCRENEGASWISPCIFWHLEIHREQGNSVASGMLFVAQAKCSKWFCEHNLPTEEDNSSH